MIRKELIAFWRVISLPSQVRSFLKWILKTPLPNLALRIFSADTRIIYEGEEGKTVRVSDNPKEFHFLLPAEPCHAVGPCETGRLLKTANSLQVGNTQPNRHVIPAAIFSHPVCRHLPGGQIIAPYSHLMSPVISLVTVTREDTSLTVARRPHKRVHLTNSFCGHMSIHKHTDTNHPCTPPHPRSPGSRPPLRYFFNRRQPGGGASVGAGAGLRDAAAIISKLLPCVLRKSGGAKSWAGIRKSGRSLAVHFSTADIVLLAALRGPCRKCR